MLLPHLQLSRPTWRLVGCLAEALVLCCYRVDLGHVPCLLLCVLASLSDTRWVLPAHPRVAMGVLSQGQVSGLSSEGHREAQPVRPRPLPESWLLKRLRAHSCSCFCKQPKLGLNMSVQWNRLDLRV